MLPLTVKVKVIFMISTAKIVRSYGPLRTYKRKEVV